MHDEEFVIDVTLEDPQDQRCRDDYREHVAMASRGSAIGSM